MNAERMVYAFGFKYPGKSIIQEPSAESPTAVICEIEPASEHPEYSVARVALGSFEAHYHRRSSQTYNVLRGRLTLKLVEKRDVVLHPGKSCTIPPNTVHSGVAEFEDTVVEVTSRPGWTAEDRILVEDTD